MALPTPQALPFTPLPAPSPPQIQYPDALNDMTLDLANLRRLSSFLSKTEIDFDLVSAVDELAAQIRLEFDFRREARVMDAVADQFKVGGGQEVDSEIREVGPQLVCAVQDPSTVPPSVVWVGSWLTSNFSPSL